MNEKTKIEAAKDIRLLPLAMEARIEDGWVEKGLELNEVSIFVGDGLIVSTAVVSTACNLSARRSCGTHLDGSVE